MYFVLRIFYYTLSTIKMCWRCYKEIKIYGDVLIKYILYTIIEGNEVNFVLIYSGLQHGPGHHYRHRRRNSWTVTRKPSQVYFITFIFENFFYTFCILPYHKINLRHHYIM